MSSLWPAMARGRATRSFSALRPERSPQQVALRAWLIEVAEGLIAPDIDDDLDGAPGGGAATQAEVLEGPWAGAVAREQRFDYFLRRLARA